MLDDYLTIAEAAAELGIEYKALLARISRGNVKAHRKGQRLLLVHVDEVKRVKGESR